MTSGVHSNSKDYNKIVTDDTHTTIYKRQPNLQVYYNLILISSNIGRFRAFHKEIYSILVEGLVEDRQDHG